MPVGNRRFGDIGIDGCRTDTNQHGKMMHIKTFTTCHIDRGKCPQLLAHKMRMHRAGCQNHRQWHTVSRHIKVGQHDMFTSRAHRFFGLGLNTVKRRMKRIIAAIIDKSTVNGGRLIAKIQA